MPLVAGTRLGVFEILAPLGKGGMGEVYRAKDTQLEREVAVKVLAEKMGERPDRIARFEREAKLLAALDHPHIAAIHGLHEEGGQHFLVMELVEGQTLADRLRHGPLGVPEALELGQQIARALEAAHEKRIIHRDLKPSNVMLTSLGAVKILDFGLARVLALDSDSLTTTGRVLGTPAYMAPEQQLGYRMDARSDIYSLGLVLFELVTGRRPFECRQDRSLGLESDKKSVPRACEIDPRVPGPLSDAIARAMSWAPDERQQSVAELGEQLNRIERAEEEPTLTAVDGTKAATSISLPKRPRVKAALVVAAVVATLLAWLVWTARLPPVSEGPAVVAVLPFDNLSGDPSNDHVGVGIAHTLATKLSALPSITMVWRTAAGDYEGSEQDTRKLARDLGASFVVRGSVQRVADTLHFTANLVRSDDSIAWGGEFEGRVDDLFELQRRLAGGLTEALHLNLTPPQKRRLDTPLTANVNAYGDYSQGRYFLERAQGPEDLGRGIELLESAVGKAPDFALAYAALGKAYWERFEETTDRAWTEKARGAAERARAIDPDHPSVHYVLAVIYNGTGEARTAEGELRRALALQPNYDDAHRLLGEIIAARGDLDAAAVEFQKAIAIRPHFWGHHRDLGIALYQAGKFEQAVKAFQRVTELQPDLAIGFHMLGATYQTMGEPDRAIQNYRRSIELKPSAPSLNNLGTIYYREGEFAEAARSYEQSVELQPSRPISHRNLGDAYRRLGETEKAHAAYRRAAHLHQNLLEVNPNDGRQVALLALMLAKLGDFDEAGRLAERAVDLAPLDPQVWYHNAVVQTLAGRADDGIAALESAIKHGYSTSEIRADDDLDSLRKLHEFRSLTATSN